MARLTAAARRKIPTSEFAGPGRSFPIEDKAHARAALSLAHFAADPAAIKAKVHAKYPSMGKAGHMAKAHEHVMAAHRQHNMSSAREHLALAADHLKKAGANTKKHDAAERHSQIGGYDFRTDPRNK